MGLGVYKWKAQPVEFGALDHGYSMMVSRYYKCRNIRGIDHYKITSHGLWKIKEGRLMQAHHNFLVYLAGKGLRLISADEFENGDKR